MSLIPISKMLQMETVFLILPAPMKPNFQKRRLSKKRQMIFNPLNVTPAS